MQEDNNPIEYTQIDLGEEGVINPVDKNIVVDSESGILNFMKGDLVKTTGGTITGLVAGIIGTTLYITPVEKIDTNDDGMTPKEQLQIEVSTPQGPKIETHSLSEANFQIQRIESFKAPIVKELEDTIAAIESTSDQEELMTLNNRKSKLEIRIQTYSDAITYWQSFIDKVQPELDKLPPRNEQEA